MDVCAVGLQIIRYQRICVSVLFHQNFLRLTEINNYFTVFVWL